MPSHLRVPAVAALQPPDTHNSDNDPHRLLKLSASLRSALAQPLARRPPGQNAQGPEYYPPGAATFADPHGWSQQPPGAQAVQESQHQPLPALKGPGTRSGPYTGFASKDWLQREVRHDVDSLRKHVDEYASKREQRAFDVERTALQAEIAQLRKRLAESEAKVIKLELMLPEDNGDFRRLRGELEELEQEADHFCALYERHAAATKAALAGYRQALEGIGEIEQEFDLVQRIIAAIPEPGAAGSVGAAYGVYGVYGAQGGGTMGPPQQQHTTPQQAGAAAAASPKACCGCFRFGRR